jgi:hypothetical protein
VTPDTHPVKPSPRFLLLEDVAEVLSTTRVQVYPLVRSGGCRRSKSVAAVIGAWYEPNSRTTSHRHTPGRQRGYANPFGATEADPEI